MSEVGRRVARRGAEVPGQEVPGRPRRRGAGDVSGPDPARRAALKVLKAIRTKDAYTNFVLPHELGNCPPAGPVAVDAAIATELGSRHHRRQGTYDAVLAACTDRPLSGHRGEQVLDVLRLGCHQLLGMRIITHRRSAPASTWSVPRSGPVQSGFVERGVAQGLGPRPRGLARPARHRARHAPLPPGMDRRRPGRGPHRGRGEDEIDALLAAAVRPPRR